MLGRASLAVFLCLAGCTALRGLEPLDAGASGVDAALDAHRADTGAGDAALDAWEVDASIDDAGIDAHVEDAGCSAAMVGMPCDGADSDRCNEGTITGCALGVVTCSDTTADSVETCAGISADEDCDGSVDEAGALGIRTWYPDADGDGVGTDVGVLMRCERPSGGEDRYVNEGGDCDDTDNDVRPGRSESCDGLDQDCDGAIDDGASCDFTCVRETYGGHTYQFCALSRPQATAETRCTSFGYHLVQIDDAAENAFVHGVIDAAPIGMADAWIGLERFPSGSMTFRWPDGTAPVYTAWAPAEPSSGSDCVRMRPDGAWGDIACGNNYGFVCETP